MRLGLAVDGELERAAEADRDLAAVGHLLVEARGDHVVAAEVDALGVEDLADGVAGGGDRLGLAVEAQGHGLGARGVPEGRAGHGENHQGRQGDHQGAALEQAG